MVAECNYMFCVLDKLSIVPNWTLKLENNCLKMDII